MPARLLPILTFAVFALTSTECLHIAEPETGSSILLDSSGSFALTIDLGPRTRIPTHGTLAVFVNEKRKVLLCPDSVIESSSCPTQGQELAGKFSLDVGGVPPGDITVTVELLDASSAPILAESSWFSAVAASELDESLPESTPAFNLIIFSKDRACQLDQLLTSLWHHVPNIETARLKTQVLYDFSEKKFGEGYDAVKKMHPHVLFHQQNNMSASFSSVFFEAHVARGGSPQGFKAEYLRILDDSIPYTMHFVDDMVVVNRWGLTEQLTAHRILSSRPDVIAVSLRLHSGITKCFATNDDHTPPPDMDSEGTWPWAHAKGDWSYPMSLDAHIFRTAEHSVLALELDYFNPNTLEGNMAVFCYAGTAQCAPRLFCYPDGKVINIPANRVQDTYPNRFMVDAPSAQLLNTEFLFHRRLSSQHLWHRTFDAAHIPQPLVFAVGAFQRRGHEEDGLG